MSDIAIVGLSVRFPGAHDVRSFWQLVQEAEPQFRSVPPSRWRHASFFTPGDRRSPYRTYTDKVAFLDDVERFSALGYGIPPRRAMAMDPQQRLMVDLAREAIQDAGWERRPFDRAGTGVYIGISHSDHMGLTTTRLRATTLADGSLHSGEPDHGLLAAIEKAADVAIAPLQAFSMAGNLPNMAACAVSNIFDLGGPVFAVDAACSSSLVALHTAVMALRARTCSAALVGGVSLSLAPDAMVGFSRVGALSGDGVCRPFDERADGFVLGEGAGMVVLRRLADAARDGDRIYAVVKGVGISNDGRTDGPMTPRVEGQAAAMRAAYADAGVPPESVAFFEAHGTATAVGDQVEIAALRRVVPGGGTSPAYLGSIKALIGHSLAAAGMAGLAKAVLAVHHARIPPHPPTRLRASLGMAEAGFTIPTGSVAWPAAGATPRRAAVSAFGFGGTNVHVVLEQAPEQGSTHARSDEVPWLFLLSAGSVDLLAGHARAVRDAVSGDHGITPTALAYTLATRSLLPARLAIVATTREEVVEKLTEAAGRLQAGKLGDFGAGITSSACPLPEADRRIAFLYPGQGAQRLGGSSLLTMARRSATGPVEVVALGAEEPDGGRTFLAGLGRLACSGVPVDLLPLFDPTQRRLVTIPPTPLATRRYSVRIYGSRATGNGTSPAPAQAPVPRRPTTRPSAPHPVMDSGVTDSGRAVPHRPQELMMDNVVRLLEKQLDVLHAIAAGSGAPRPGMPGIPEATWARTSPIKDRAGTPGAASREATESTQRAPSPGAPAAAEAGSSFPPALRQAPTEPVGGTAAIRDQLVELVSGISAYPTEHLQGSHAFVADLGFDSIMMTDLIRAIRARWPHLEDAAPEEFFGLRTVDDAVEWLAKGTGGRTRPRASAAGTPLPAVVPLQVATELAAAPGAVQGPVGAVPETTDIAAFPEVSETLDRLSFAGRMGVQNPYFLLHEGNVRDRTRVAGRELTCFSTYNYLGLSGHLAVNEAVTDAVRRYGSSVSAARILSGDRPLHRELEAALAALVGAEDCLTLVSGHATNVTLIGHIVGAGDLIVHDALAHDSILQGCRLSGATRRPFPHNDVAALDTLLGRVRGRFRRVLVIAEGVYSMDGDIADLPGLVDIRRRHGTLLMVDEAHSIGVLGRTGRGLAEYFGADRTDVDVWMGTLSKSLAGCGGYLAGSSVLIEYLRYTLPGFIFSAGLTPPNAAASLAAVQVMLAEPDRLARLRENSRLFLRLAQEAGVDTGTSEGTPIIPCVVGDSAICLRLADALFRRGVSVNPILYPAVEEKLSRLRFFVTSEHTGAQIENAVEVLSAELREVGLANAQPALATQPPLVTQTAPPLA